MSDRAAFRATILDAPFDDAPRLVFADWLMENGRLLGDFIKVQCDLAALVADPQAIRSRATQCYRLRTRALELFLAIFPRRDVYTSDALADRLRVEFAPSVVGTYRRGFVESVDCPCRVFLKNAANWFRTHPLVRVTLTDRQPATFPEPGVGWHWVSRRGIPLRPAECLPPDLLAALEDGRLRTTPAETTREYPTQVAAELDLARACVRYGRALVGLRPFGESTRPDGGT